MRHHSQIKQPDAIFIGQENVTRMWIGMKEPVNQYLLQVSAKDLLRQMCAVYFNEAQGADFRYFPPGNVVHGEHARGRVIVDGFGNDYVFELTQTSAQLMQ